MYIVEVETCDLCSLNTEASHETKLAPKTWSTKNLKQYKIIFLNPLTSKLNGFVELLYTLKHA